ARRIGGGADRSRLLAGRRTVRRVARREPMSLDHAREAAALRGALDVDALALLEQRHGEALADLEAGDVGDPELPEVARRRQVPGLELAEHRLGETRLLVGAESQLPRRVPVALRPA